MASTTAHDAATMIVGTGCLALGIYYGITELLYVGSGVIFGGIWLSPDLDWGPGVLVNGQVHTRERMSFITREIGMKRLVFGKITRRWLLLEVWWKFFAYLFTHRGVSHYPIIGLIVRGAWIAFITVPMTYLLWPYSLLVWGGMLCSDFVHLMLDGGGR